MCIIREARQGLVPSENVRIVGHDTSILVTTVQRPARVDAAIVIKVRAENHQVALLRKVVVIEIEPGPFVGAWIGLKTKGVPSSSCGWDTAGGYGIGWNEEWLRLDSGKVGCIGKPFCEWIPKYWIVEERHGDRKEVE